MAGGAQPCIDISGIVPVHTEGPPQPIFVRRHRDDMHMVRHQAVGPNLDPRPFRSLREQIKIQRIVAIFKKRPLAPVAPLGYVMGNAREDEAGKASYEEGDSRKMRSRQ